MTCGEPEALLYARGPHWRRRCVCKERLRAALRWCSSRPRLARMGPLRHHGAPAQQHRAEPVRHSVPLCCCSRKPHRRLTRESCRSCVRTYLTYISETVQEQREAGPQHACISLRDRSQQRWLAFSGYFVARRVCECDSVWGAGAAWRGSFWPISVRFPPLLVPSPLSLIRRPPRPRPGRIHVRAPPPARGAGAQLPALELLYYRVSCGGVCVVQCVG